jgi:hypothetical protein
VCQTASAGIKEQLAAATILEDFRFDDPAGTAYDAAANSANPGNLLSNDPDLDGVVTDGAGRLSAFLKNNNEFGTTLVDTADRMSGRVFGVMEMTWNFQSVLDPAENEELRITLISSGTSGVLAEFEIQREDDDTLTILGNAVGTGTVDIDPVVLNGGSLSQLEKFIGVVEADLDNNTFQVHFSNDAGATFTTIGSGVTETGRFLDKMRIVLNNDLFNDRVFIDRAYLATIPEPASVGLVAIGLIGAVATRRRNA